MSQGILAGIESTESEPNSMGMLGRENGLKITLISLHGLIRANEPELGRDVDTGGQVKYVLELARELAGNEHVREVELLTRQIIDPKVGEDYAQISESICENAKIIRIPFGPKRYLKKEALWPYIEMFVDQSLVHFRRTSIPDILHGHYADAGLAGAQLARLLHVPFIFTGHSLGRVKQQRLALGKKSSEGLEQKYKFDARYEAEEIALETASMVVTSTSQEVEMQYELYDHYDPSRMEVIAPGVDLQSFSPPTDDWLLPPIQQELDRFLRDPERPIILSMARLDERKNLEKLVEVYGRSSQLQEQANLVLVMGTRDDFRDLPKAQQKIINNILHLIDKYDLYGKVAYPKQHKGADIADLYRLAVLRRGVFINPALTEPFGLTLLEAGASGLPIVATHDGGPRDIIANCENGLLVDPLDGPAIERALLRVLTEPEQWERWSQNGRVGTRKHYSWTKHSDRYLRDLDDILEHTAIPTLMNAAKIRRLPEFDRMIVTDLDNTLTGDASALADFNEMIRCNDHMGFCVATGRRMDDALHLIEELGLPKPDVLATDAGTQLHYGDSLTPDLSWQKQIGFAWKPRAVRELLDAVPGLFIQPAQELSEFKISYVIDPKIAPSLVQIKKMLREAGLRAKVTLSLEIYLDVVPVRGGSDMSMGHLLYKWGFSPEKVLVAGDSGNDAGMLLGRVLGVVVANYSPELEFLRDRPRIYFAKSAHARGILEGVEYYQFLTDIVIPNDQFES